MASMEALALVTKMYSRASPVTVWTRRVQARTQPPHNS